jgi:hypothetical protein
MRNYSGEQGAAYRIRLTCDYSQEGPGRSGGNPPTVLPVFQCATTQAE